MLLSSHAPLQVGKGTVLRRDHLVFPHLHKVRWMRWCPSQDTNMTEYRDRRGELLSIGDVVDGYTSPGGPVYLPRYQVMGFAKDFVLVANGLIGSGRVIRKYQHNLQRCDSDLDVDVGL